MNERQDEHPNNRNTAKTRRRKFSNQNSSVFGLWVRRLAAQSHTSSESVVDDERNNCFLFSSQVSGVSEPSVFGCVDSSENKTQPISEPENSERFFYSSEIEICRLHNTDANNNALESGEKKQLRKSDPKLPSTELQMSYTRHRARIGGVFASSSPLICVQWKNNEIQSFRQHRH